MYIKYKTFYLYKIKNIKNLFDKITEKPGPILYTSLPWPTFHWR